MSYAADGTRTPHPELDSEQEFLENARQQFFDAMQRDRADRGLAAVAQAAKEATRGLIEDGPVKLANTELARLDQEAEHADRQAERWAQIAQRLDAQATEHQDEADAALRAAEQHAATVRAEVTEPLTVQAQTDGRDYLEAVADEADATARLRTTGRSGRRRAEHGHQAARDHTEALRGHLRTEWGTVPASMTLSPSGRHAPPGVPSTTHK